MEQIVLATGNKGKIREFSEAFSHLSIDCVPVKAVISIEEPEETGTTFMENALLKARYYAKATNRSCLADDSGITVDVLNGAPGVYSARYAGRHGFNYWYSYGTFDEHKNPHYWDTDGKRHDPKEWSPLHESGKVVSYLKNEGNVRDTKKPFFIMVGMNPPHSPYRSLNDCEEQDFNLYKDQPLDSLLIRPNVDLNMKKAESVRYYFASVTGVDRAFGQILEALKQLGLDKNTVVIFASDHGETMCSQRTDDPKNSPYSESMNIPFLVRFPGKIQPRVDDLLLSAPDIMPTVLGLCGLGDSIPAEVQGRNFAPLFFDEKAEIVRPAGALYIQNLDGEKDKDGLVQSYFPSSRGIKTARYTLALYIDRETKQLKKSLLFDDVNDPYQLNNLPLDENKEVVEQLYREMGAMLKEIDDPWYTEKILSDRIPY